MRENRTHRASLRDRRSEEERSWPAAVGQLPVEEEEEQEEEERNPVSVADRRLAEDRSRSSVRKIVAASPHFGARQQRPRKIHATTTTILRAVLLGGEADGILRS